MSDGFESEMNEEKEVTNDHQPTFQITAMLVGVGAWREAAFTIQTQQLQALTSALVIF